jgi:hypothetical protein
MISLKSYFRDSDILIPIFLIAFLVIFPSKLTEIINRVLVKPLLSSVVSSSFLIDFILILISLIILRYFLFKAINEVHLSISSFTYPISICIVYLKYKFSDPPEFIFTHFKTDFLSSFYLCDIILIPTIGIIIYWSIKIGIRYFSPEQKVEMKLGFYTDSPIILTDLNDPLLRYPYILEIKEKLLATKTTSQSFAIGIIGQWGSGKTTFIETLESSLKTEKDVIQIRFNPWASGNSTGITAIFFETLAIKLSEYDGSLKKKVLSYSKELIHALDNQSLSILRAVFSFFDKDLDIEEKYKHINESIRRLNKKIVVYIDDVDRLDKKEILDVLRIVRNTANFSNTYFIVAFDKVYVSEGIKEALTENSRTFLEKIFQLEYYLPLHPNKLVYFELLISELKKQVDVKGKEVLEQIQSPPPSFTSIEILPPIYKFFNSFRDVNRFMNIFQLNYDRLKENIYLPDYISLCILKLRFPEVYNLIYYNKYRFLSQSGIEGAFFEIEQGKLYLAFHEVIKNDPKETLLYNFLAKNQKRFSLNVEEMDTAIDLIVQIFGIKIQLGNIAAKRTLYNNHMSVTYDLFFDRYFDCSMEGRLDDVLFRKILEKPLKELENKLEELNQTREIANDLDIKLENLNEFSNTDDFEKKIRAIVFFADLPVPNNPYRTNQFNIDNFYSKLGGQNNEINAVIRNFYLGNKEKFKDFFRSLFNTDPLTRKWGFISEFSVQLIRENQGNFAFSLGELKDLLSNNFIESVEAHKNLTRSLMQFYRSSIRNFSDKNSQLILPIEQGILMTEKLRELIEKDINIFLEWNISKDPDPRSNGYVIGNWQRIIFESDEQFEIVLDKHKGDPAVDEFSKFYYQFKETRISIHGFEFRYLNIE